MNNREVLEKKLQLKRLLVIKKAQNSFWDYCKVESPDFYTESKWHLKIFAWSLQALYERRLTKGTFLDAVQDICPEWFKPIAAAAVKDYPDDMVYTRFMINLPPRLGKSRTLVNFCKWALGKDLRNKVITCSYNDDMAQDFSRYTRDGIDEEKTFPHEIVFGDIFPDAKIKQGNASYQQWALEGVFFSYKGSGVGGSITGKGCNISIVDDPVKDAAEAFNSNRLDVIWQWYTGTFKSRNEKGGIEIINMTRWAKGDICGRVLDNPNEGKKWFVFKMEAYYKEPNEYLCPDLLDEERYNDLKDVVDESIFWANYHQQPVDIMGRLYKDLKTYIDVPKDENNNPLFEQIINYTDTADKGADYLCSICAGVYKGQAYILDVLYTKESMEITEPATAQLLFNNRVGKAHIESNNGGRGFARNVERLLWENHKSSYTAFDAFTQTKNKESRILSNANNVMKNVYFPINWRERFPEFYEAITQHQREGKNKHDDAADTLTGIAEMIETGAPRIRTL